MQNNSNPQISLLKWMFEDIRKTTLEGVSHLTKEQLFTPPVEGEFPIGAYLMHFAECDLGWLHTLSGKEASDEIKKRSYYAAWFDTPKEDYNPPKEPLEVKEYIDVITLTRKMFLDHVSTIKDSELDDVITWQGYNEQERSATKKWIIYHILEHEAHTRGQMFMLIRKAGWKKSS
ncbi:MAG: DinB family protein [Ignavibacteriae bacterium]|nr:MAG: DinB family protein [Ignavibacteriota bacterium]